jgi:hypothetical protein
MNSVRTVFVFDGFFLRSKSQIFSSQQIASIGRSVGQTRFCLPHPRLLPLLFRLFPNPAFAPAPFTAAYAGRSKKEPLSPEAVALLSFPGRRMRAPAFPDRASL